MAAYPTPHIAHLTADDYEHVYEPAEDTFALLDALEKDASYIQDAQPTLCVEIGSGSGVVSAFLSKILGASDCLILNSDVNAYACDATKRTGAANEVMLDPIQCDLLRPFLARMAGQVDVLVFNPPYVETLDEESTEAQASKDLLSALSGGLSGMRITTEVLAQVPLLLAPGGRFYLVSVEQNHPERIIRTLTSHGLASDILLIRRAGRERLSIIRSIRCRPSM